MRQQGKYRGRDRVHRQVQVLGEFAHHPRAAVAQELDEPQFLARQHGVRALQRDCLHLLELVDRYHAVTERLVLCRDRLRELHLHRYLGDVAL